MNSNNQTRLMQPYFSLVPGSRREGQPGAGGHGGVVHRPAAMTRYRPVGAGLARWCFV
jgi:hypothetical protein